MKKINKWVITPLLAGSVVFPQLVHADNGHISVFVDKKLVEFDQNPVLFGDVTLVPLRGVFEELGAGVKWDQSTQTVTILKGENTITLKQASPDVFVNNNLQKLQTEPQLLNSRIMVPLRFISEALKAKVDWDSNNRTINISQNTNNDTSQTSAPKNENSNTLTYEKALQNALAYSFTLKNAEKEIDKAGESRDDFAEYFYYSTPFGTGNSQEESQIRNSYLGLLSAEDKLKKAELNLKNTKEELTYQVKQAYNDVIQKDASKVYYEKALAIEELNFQIAKVQLGQGVISQIQFEQLENNLNAMKKTFEASKKSLAQANIKLNQLMGFSTEQTYSLVDIPEFEEIGYVDVDYHITQTLENHPTIFELEQAKELAKKAVDYYSYNPVAVGENYQTKKITATTIANQIEQAKDSISEAVRTTYLNIKSLEDQYKILQTNLSNAQKSLQVTKEQYEVGQTTELDLKQKELQVAELESKIQETVISLDNIHLIFEKPWVAIGATSQSQ